METFEEQPPQHQVFINFRGSDLRNTLVSHLVTYLELFKINVFIDNHEDRGEPLDVVLKRIEESKIALVIFSEHYTESEWCLKELDKIKDCSDERTLKVIPIFYELEPSTVKNLEGKFGDGFRSLAKGDERKKKWKEAFNSITNMVGFTIHEKSDQSRVCLEIVEKAKKLLNKTPTEGSQMATVEPSGNSNVKSSRMTSRK